MYFPRPNCSDKGPVWCTYSICINARNFTCAEPTIPGKRGKNIKECNVKLIVIDINTREKVTEKRFKKGKIHVQVTFDLCYPTLHPMGGTPTRISVVFVLALAAGRWG